MTVSALDQLPRAALLWIIMAQMTLLAPHAPRLPLWVMALFAAAALWRALVFRDWARLPPRWLKLPLALAVFGGVYASYGSLIGLEPTVALLLAAFALKLLESVAVKDGYLLIFLGYFVCVTIFLFSQTLPLVVYMVLPVTLLTTALLALHLPAQSRLRWAPMKKAAGMLCQAIPLMVVLFFIFPRLGPLWQVPLKQSGGTTGVSDMMKPGDISRLSQSDDVAFRVQFDGEIPSRDKLYWRGPVLSRFNDGAWRTLREHDRPFRERLGRPFDGEGESLRYSVILEPTGQTWLYALRRPQADTAGIRRLPEDQLLLAYPVQDRYAYRMVSWPDVPLDSNLSQWRRDLETRLPDGENPRTVALARRLYARAGNAEAYIDSVLSYFSTQTFYYTLEPPLLSDRDPMDDFLFNSRRGFCEHYSYAFVVMMRAAGIPARVVAGYQGGEINPVNGTVIVRQYDAHAWTELWLPSVGWRRVDPTAAVSPQRIELGLQQAAAEEFLSDTPLSAMHFTNIRWLNKLRLQYDALVYRWQKFVLSYDAASQYVFLYKMLGGVSTERFLALLGSVAFLVLVPVAWFLLRSPKSVRTRAQDKILARLQRKLARRGLAREPGEAVASWGARVVKAHPRAASDMRTIVRLYHQLSYRSPTGDSKADLAQLRAVVSRLRLS